jgi:hypothetical protein
MDDSYGNTRATLSTEHYRATLQDHRVNIGEIVDMDDSHSNPRATAHYRATLQDHRVNIGPIVDMDESYSNPREMNPSDNLPDGRNTIINPMTSKARELTKSRGDIECCICYSNDFDAVVFHCLHYTCTNCYKRLLMGRHLKCPLCRLEFGDVVFSNQPQ